MTPTPRPFRRRATQGFTLVELVIGIVLLGVIAALGSVMLREGFNAYFAGRDLTDADWQARVALGRMTRELREAQDREDIVGAEETLRRAFFTDTTPLIGLVRQEMGIEPDAIAAHRTSGYEARVAQERTAKYGAAAEASYA